MPDLKVWPTDERAKEQRHWTDIEPCPAEDLIWQVSQIQLSEVHQATPFQPREQQLQRHQYKASQILVMLISNFEQLLFDTFGYCLQAARNKSDPSASKASNEYQITVARSMRNIPALIIKLFCSRADAEQKAAQAELALLEMVKNWTDKAAPVAAIPAQCAKIKQSLIGLREDPSPSALMRAAIKAREAWYQLCAHLNDVNHGWHDLCAMVKLVPRYGFEDTDAKIALDSIKPHIESLTAKANAAEAAEESKQKGSVEDQAQALSEKLADFVEHRKPPPGRRLDPSTGLETLRAIAPYTPKDALDAVKKSRPDGVPGGNMGLPTGPDRGRYLGPNLPIAKENKTVNLKVSGQRPPLRGILKHSIPAQEKGTGQAVLTSRPLPDILDPPTSNVPSVEHAEEASSIQDEATSVSVFSQAAEEVGRLLAAGANHFVMGFLGQRSPRGRRQRQKVDKQVRVTKKRRFTSKRRPALEKGKASIAVSVEGPNEAASVVSALGSLTAEQRIQRLAKLIGEPPGDDSGGQHESQMAVLDDSPSIAVNHTARGENTGADTLGLVEASATSELAANAIFQPVTDSLTPPGMPGTTTGQISQLSPSGPAEPTPPPTPRAVSFDSSPYPRQSQEIPHYSLDAPPSPPLSDAGGPDDVRSESGQSKIGDNDVRSVRSAGTVASDRSFVSIASDASNYTTA